MPARGDAFGGRHARSGADPLAIGVGNRRAENVDIPALQERRERIVPAGRRPVLQRSELEEIAVEEHDQLAAVRTPSAGGGHGGHVIGHLLLLVASEVDQTLFPGGVSQEAVRVGSAFVRRRRLGRIRLRVAVRFEPLPEGGPGARVVPAQRPFPRILVEPLARVLPAGMNAGEVIRERFKQMPADLLQMGAHLIAIGAIRDAGMVHDFAAVVDHACRGVAHQPPVRSVGTDARNKQDPRVGRDDLAAQAVERRPVDGRVGRRPAIRC